MALARGKQLVAAIDEAGEFVLSPSGKWRYQDALCLELGIDAQITADQLRDIADELDFRNGVCTCGGELSEEIDYSDFPLGIG